MPDQKQIKKLATRRHPEYREMLPHWQFMERTYEGGRKWFKDNIFKFYKEGKEYDNRVKRAYRFNHTREVVDLINKYLFRAEISRVKGDAPSAVIDFWNNTNGEGMNIDEFMRIVSLKSSIAGCPWIIVDSDLKDLGDNASQRDAEDSKIYAYVVMPEMILDMSWGEDGELNWLLVKESVRDDENPWDSTGDKNDRYRLWTRNEWFLYELENPSKKGSEFIESSGTHNLGMVPAFRADNLISDNQYVSPALINDIAYLDRAVANYLSNLDEIIQDQTFSQLAIPAQGILPGQSGAGGDDEHAQLIEVGTKRVFTYDGEHGSEPKFISPDPRQAQLILSAIQQIINEIYHSVGLAGERTKQDNSKGIDNSSGVAKAADFERVNSLLIAKSDALERVENKLSRIVAAWAGQEDSLDEENELVSYPESFDVRGLFDEFDIATQLALIDVPEEIRGKQLKVVVEKLFPAASKKERKEIEGIVESWVEELKEQARMQSEAFKEMKSSAEEESVRDREMSGERQSATKQREANRASESDQAKGQ